MQNNLLFFEQGLTIKVENEKSDFFYTIDYDLRAHDVKMDFQHYHKHHQIFLLADDNAGFVLEGEHYAINLHDIVLIKPFLLHKSEYNIDSGARRLIITFCFSDEHSPLGSALNEVLTIFDEEMPVFRFADSIQGKLLSAINEIFTINKQPSPLQELITCNKLLEFLCIIYQNRSHNRYMQQNVTDSMVQKIYMLTSYIQSNYSQELDLDQLARRIYVSPCYLSHQFKKITGFTLINYIQTTRIRNAQHYLLYTNMRISDIAERCGFTSFSHFNRVFHKFCGKSPSDFRASGSLTLQP